MTKIISDEQYARLKKYEQEERNYFIDNLYRAGVLRDYCNVSQTTEELRDMWSKYW